MKFLPFDQVNQVLFIFLFLFSFHFASDSPPIQYYLLFIYLGSALLESAQIHHRFWLQPQNKKVFSIQLVNCKFTELCFNIQKNTAKNPFPLFLSPDPNSTWSVYPGLLLDIFVSKISSKLWELKFFSSKLGDRLQFMCVMCIRYTSCFIQTLWW